MKLMKKSIKKFLKRNKTLSNLFDWYNLIIDSKVSSKNKKLIDKDVIKFIKTLYFKHMKTVLNLDNPQSFNEKLQWLKLYWYDERATICADKYRVREYVKEKGLDYILNDLVSVYDNTSEIDIKQLPDKFVLKATHDSGGILICKNKRLVNWRRELKQFDYKLRVNFSYISGEWPYRDIKPKIICEKFLEDENRRDLLEYKFFCFNGKAELIFVTSNRSVHVNSDFYDLEWNLMPFRWLYEPSMKIFPKPEKLTDMINYSNILSEGFPHVRVDFYQIDKKVIFGELTFFHGGGFGFFKPEKFDYLLGEKIILPKKSDPWGRSC